MISTLINDHLCVEISALGAEIQSIQDRHTGQEYIWQGDARWWAGRSPLLFPIVGSLWNGVCRIEGKEIHLPKHGFLRRREWETKRFDVDFVRYEASHTEEDLAIFPFPFTVAITYRLKDRELLAEMEVTNTGTDKLWFQMGGHPAIQLPNWDETREVNGYLQLEGELQHIGRAGEQGCLEPEQHAVPTDEQGRIELKVDNFIHDALIFDAEQVKAANVLDANGKRVARIESSAPVWLFWTPAGKNCPFICCEPWYGLCDHQGFEGPVSERPFIQQAEPGETWKGYFKIEVEA